MYVVIGSLQSRALRPLWMLEELELPYEHHPHPPRSDGARVHSPDGKIPVLLDDGEAILDSVAMIQYLADKHGALTYPAGTLERARQDALTQFCIDEIEGALWTSAKNSFVHPEDKRTPAVKETCRYEFGLAMERLGKRLGDNDFATGDMMTVPDILFGHCAGWAKAAKFDLPAGTVGAYFDRLRARPAFTRAVSKATPAA